MKYATSSSAAHFNNRQAQGAAAVFFGIFALLGLGALMAEDSKLWPLTMLACGAAFAIRGGLASSVHLTSDRIVLLGMLRTRAILWSDVASVGVAEGPTGMNSGRRDYLSIRLKSGSIVTFTEFNASQNARPTSEVWAAHWAALKHLHGEST